MAMFACGTHFAGCTIVRLVGAGRVAEVYEVVAPDGARRALKLAKTDAPLDSKLVARLAQEAEILATIEHVNVVRFFGAGVTLGRVWLLLELVEGKSLAELVAAAGGGLPVERVVRLARQACEGVAAAHALGILHRDLAPGNVLVTADDVAKVTDFGSAKLDKYGVQTTSEQDVSSSLCQAPEYAKARVATRESDVYSMGLLMYEALTGTHPIAPAPMSAIDIVRRHLSYEPPALATLGSGIPGDLSDLVAQAMAKDPARRGSMQAMAERLRVVLHRLHVGRREAARALPVRRELGLARTEPAMAAFDVEEERSAAAAPAAQSAPAASPATMRSAAAEVVARPAKTVRMEAVAGPGESTKERGSTAVSVERLVVAAAGATEAKAGRKPRAIVMAAGVVGALVLVVALLAAGWWVTAGRGAGGGEVASGAGTAPSARVGTTATAATAAPAPAAASAPRAKPAPPRGAPGRTRLPLK